MIVLKEKIYALLIHLLISFIIFVFCFILVYFFWYPNFHFWVNGGIEGLRIIFIVDMFIGPLLTFIVYNKTKSLKEKFSDFSIIFLVQLAALSYGLRTVYLDKPAFMFVTQGATASVVTLRDFKKDYHGVTLEQMPKIAGLPTAFQGLKTDENQGYVPLDRKILEFGQSQEKLYFSLDRVRVDTDILDFIKKEGYLIYLFGHYKETLIHIDRNLEYINNIDINHK